MGAGPTVVIQLGWSSSGILGPRMHCTTLIAQPWGQDLEIWAPNLLVADVNSNKTDYVPEVEIQLNELKINVQGNIDKTHSSLVSPGKGDV